MPKKEFMDLVEEKKLVAILRGIKESKLEPLVKALKAGGVEILEITLNTPNALKMINLLRDKYKDGDLYVGAGTVLNVESASEAVATGAQFIVTPSLNVDVIKYCNEKDIPVFPGALTPTEVVTAYEAGADAVKVFPATAFGPSYIKAIKGPLNHIPLMPTGGVSLDNIQEFIKVGSTCFGIGSELTNKEAIENENWSAITELAEQFVNKING